MPMLGAVAGSETEEALMARIITALDIGRPVETVWSYLTDLHNSKDWSTEVVDTEYSGPIRLGATGVDTRRWGKREVKMNWEVTEYEPPRLMTLKYGPPLNAVADFTFEPSAAGGTRVSCITTLKPSGWMRLLAPIIAAEGRKADERQFAKAKAILESTDVRGAETDNMSP
jgi:uncharacterized protein YndB with AHSA1/START domain